MAPVLYDITANRASGLTTAFYIVFNYYVCHLTQLSLTSATVLEVTTDNQHLFVSAPCIISTYSLKNNEKKQNIFYG